nr:MAG TPA: repressor protein [Caudoviricetes sp.]
MSEFKDRLKRLRERNRLSRYRLSELCGISSDQIRRYELGETKPGQEALEAIADYFEVSTDYLLGRTDYPCVVKPLSSHRRI